MRLRQSVLALDWPPPILEERPGLGAKPAS